MEDATERKDEPGTCNTIGAELTPMGSGSDLIGNLMKMRNAHGATSPVGQACSNLIEQLCVLPSYVRPAWAKDERQTLPWMIQQQVKRLAELTAGAH